MKVRLDDIDLQILDTLQHDGRMTNAKLAAKVGLSAPPMLERVKKLERMGVIQGYRAVLDATLLGKDFFVYVALNVSVKQLSNVEAFEDRVRELAEVMECYHIAGEIDFLLKVQVQDHEAYKQFVVQGLSRIEGISKIHSWVVLSTVKHNPSMLLNHEPNQKLVRS